MTIAVPATQIAQAQRLAAAIPRLTLAAERLADAVAPGPQARRRVGTGDQFWQYRDWRTGDETRRIDWRRSARTDRLLLREAEWEVPSIVNLTLHDTPGLAFAGRPGGATKQARAVLLLLALAGVLTRAGSQVALTGVTAPRGGAAGLEQIVLGLMQGGQMRVNAAARRVEFGDFLRPEPHFAGPPGGAVVQILDPAECDFTYRGRVLFTGYGTEAPVEAARAEAWADAYRNRLAAQKEAVATAARQAGQSALFHRTDAAPALVLHALAHALSTAR